MEAVADEAAAWRANADLGDGRGERLGGGRGRERIKLLTHDLKM